MDIEHQIADLLAPLDPDHCQIEDFSNQHSRGPNSHYAITLVSSQFVDTSRVQRHRLVNKALLPLLHNPVHAWTLSLYSPSEWQHMPEQRPIPRCQSSR